MKKLHFSADIKASREKVWSVLWGDKTYPQWTRVFSEGSRAVTDWQEGSKVLFLDGQGSGMYSTVAKNELYKAMTFRHEGEVKDNLELPPDEKSRQWAGSMEEYNLEQTGDRVQLTVDLDVTEDMEDYFKETFPKALERVKELAEG